MKIAKAGTAPRRRRHAANRSGLPSNPDVNLKVHLRRLYSCFFCGSNGFLEIIVQSENYFTCFCGVH
ncbi:hypothetical protein ACFOHH_08225, partial [Shinella pollutisoli]